VGARGGIRRARPTRLEAATQGTVIEEAGPGRGAWSLKTAPTGGSDRRSWRAGRGARSGAPARTRSRPPATRGGRAGAAAARRTAVRPRGRTKPARHGHGSESPQRSNRHNGQIDRATTPPEQLHTTRAPPRRERAAESGGAGPDRRGSRAAALPRARCAARPAARRAFRPGKAACGAQAPATAPHLPRRARVPWCWGRRTAARLRWPRPTAARRRRPRRPRARLPVHWRLRVAPTAPRTKRFSSAHEARTRRMGGAHKARADLHGGRREVGVDVEEALLCEIPLLDPAGRQHLRPAVARSGHRPPLANTLSRAQGGVRDLQGFEGRAGALGLGVGACEPCSARSSAERLSRARTSS